MLRQKWLSGWTPVLKVSFFKSAAHSLAAYMPLLFPGVIPRCLTGVVGPSHQLDAMHMAALSCCLQPSSFSSWPIICDSSGCYFKDDIGSIRVGGSSYSC